MRLTNVLAMTTRWSGSSPRSGIFRTPGYRNI